MELDYRMPSLDMASAISIVGRVQGVGVPLVDTVPALLPNLHIRLRGQSRYAFAGGAWQRAPAVALIGATTAAFRIEVSADFEMVCLGLLATGWGRYVGLPGSELTDTMIDAASLWPSSHVGALRDAVATAPDLTTRRAVVEGFLRTRARGDGDSDWRRVRGIEQWLERPGALTLDTLAEGLDLSARQIARVTLRSFGASPKTLAMKYRALRAAGALTLHGREAAPGAPDGFADQSHLIRDFHRFVGCTPGAFLKQRQPLARATMASRWRAGARSRLALCS